jgi:hypothetical protein
MESSQDARDPGDLVALSFQQPENENVNSSSTLKRITLDHPQQGLVCSCTALNGKMVSFGLWQILFETP